MKNTIINEIILKMQTKLNNGQLEELKKTLEHVLLSYDMTENSNIEDKNLSNQNFIELFLAAKKIEGCSIKSMKYYRAKPSFFNAFSKTYSNPAFFISST